MSGYFSDARSNTGANVRHGPHQDAQKSTSTIPSLVAISPKFSAVSATVAMCASPIWLGYVGVNQSCEVRIPPRAMRRATAGDCYFK